MGAPAELTRFAAAFAEQGFRTVKVKVGRDERTDIEAVRKVRPLRGGRRGSRRREHGLGHFEGRDPSDPRAACPEPGEAREAQRIAATALARLVIASRRQGTLATCQPVCIVIRSLSESDLTREESA
jgi:hypothetical protein